MNISEKWNRFWFSPAPYFDLAFLRILLVGVQLFVMLCDSYGDLQYMLSLPASLYNPLPAVKVLLLPMGWGALPSDDFVNAVFAVTLLAGVLSLVGLLTNLSLFIFFLGNVFIHAFIFSFGDSHHREAVMMFALLVLALGPSGRVISLDYLIRHRRGSAERAPLLQASSTFAGWPIRLLQCFFPLMYLSAVSSKLATSGLEWANGYTLQYYLIQDSLRWEGQLGMYLAQFHTPILILQYIILLFQGTFFLILFFPKLRWIYLPIGLCFHIGIYLTLRAPFPQWIALYAIFIPWAAVFRWLASQQVAAPGRPAAAS